MNRSSLSTPKRGRPKKIKLLEEPIELNIYQKYKHALSTTIKSELVFREKETKEIEEFLVTHLKKKTSSSIYISGPPGTGKTASVNFVLDKLEKKIRFKRLFFNGMSFATATSLYKRILFDLTEVTHSTKDLVPLIVEELSRPKALFLILILDEIDILNSGHQEMLNSIFNLPRYKSTKVIIIGIANTLDFTTNTLNRCHSLKIESIKEISFRPYDQMQIMGILKSRMDELSSKELKLIQDSAIEICARKVASYSGDVRKALEILRRSIELAEQEAYKSSKMNLLKENNKQIVLDEDKIKLVNVPHVIKILNSVFNYKVNEVEDDDYSFPIQQKIVLCVIVLLYREGNRNPELGKCYDRFCKICKEKNLEFEVNNNTNLFLDICETLASKSFITIKKLKDLRCSKLSLAVSEEEATEFLKSHKLLKSILF